MIVFSWPACTIVPGGRGMCELILHNLTHRQVHFLIFHCLFERLINFKAKATYFNFY